MQLENKAVLVSGASRGLGAALASALARRGSRLVLSARDPGALEQVAAQIRERGGIAHALAADIGDKHAIYPLVGSAAALVGPIDVVIHNASTLGLTPLRPLLDGECEDLSRVLEVNLLGPYRLSKAVAGSMALRKGGLLVHISSDASVQAYPTWGFYSVSKAALDHLSRLWASELDEFGVRSLSIDPGEMDTEMHRAAVPDADPSTLLAPELVAERIVAILERAETLPNGARLEAASWQA